jgi:hypothetical protein
MPSTTQTTALILQSATKTRELRLLPRSWIGSQARWIQTPSWTGSVVPDSTDKTDDFILWLYGPAGAGKTAIARRVAELCEAQGLLLASFLFFRSDPKRNTMKPLVANIAYCVSRVIPSTHELIINTIEADPLILTSSIEVQLTKLVLEPLRLLADQGYFSLGNFPIGRHRRP